MPLVVVLPWVPVTDTPVRWSMSEASAALRCQTGMPRRRASTSSTLPGLMAEETTTTSTSPTWDAS